MGDRESRVMAEKRHLEAGGAMAFSKLSRLEVDPSHIHAANFCRSGVLSGHASDSHYGYHGSYFSYPLQCHESPELSVHWNPAEPYVSCTDGAISHQLRPEKARCMLYKQESGGWGTWAENPSYEKRKDCRGRDTLDTREKWAHYSGHTDFIQQGWIQGFPMLPSSQVSAGCPPLVAPKPVYRNHGYCTDAGCSPKGSLALGMPSESLSKQTTNVECTLPSSGHQVNTNCGSAAAKKAPVAESGFLPSHQSWKDPVSAPDGFSPYRKTFENLQVPPSTSSRDASYSAENRTSVQEECARSPCGKVWSKLPPPASPFSVPQGLIYQERSSACYSLHSYPLTSHEQLGLYQQSIAQVEKQKALFSLPACKSFNSPAGEDPQLLPRTFFPPTPQNYYPGHLESYSYQASPLMTSPSLKASREHGSQQNSQPKISLEPRKPISTCSVTEKASCGSSVPSREGACAWPRAEATATPARESFQCQQMTPQPCAFQPHGSVEGIPSCVDGYRQTHEAFYGMEKGHSRELRPLSAEKQPGVSSKDEKRDADKTLPSGACIVIPDSPVTSHDSCLKGDSLRSRISDSLGSSVQQVQQSPDKEATVLKQTEAPRPPPSPPMPVIHNVFSLAPYREYLEGSAVSLHLPSSEGCPEEKPSSEESQQKAEGMTTLRPPSAGSSKTPGKLLDRGNDVAYNPSSSCIVAEKESGGESGFHENYWGYPNVPETSWQGATGCASEFSKDGHVLDLSLKAEGLPGVLHAQRPAGKAEALERENGKRSGETVNEGPDKGQEAIPDINSSAAQLPQNNSSEKSNFQSSSAFLYKKFKILKSHAAGPGSTTQVNFLFLSTSPTGALSNNFPLQRDSEQGVTQQNCLPFQQGSQQVATQQNSLPLQQSSQQVATQQNSLPLQQSSQQVATQQNSLPLQQSSQWSVTQHNSLPGQKSGQVVTRQNSLPVQQSSPQMVTRQNSLPALPVAHEKPAKPNTQRWSRKCLKQPDASELPPPAAPAKEVSASLPAGCESPARQASLKKYFTALHASVCAAVSNSVSTSSPELLRKWLEKTAPEREPNPKTSGSAKAKSGPKSPEAPELSKAKRVWLDFKDAAGLLNQLLQRLETILFTRQCPFPHVVRAGTIFIPIHVVKEQLFGNLPATSVDHVLQAHKVELRPTTLSEEKLLRELDLKTCTSRMLKLLALKQLPDIYPDLLDLHWHLCVKQQLGEPAEEIQSGNHDVAGVDGLEAVDVSRCLQRTTHVLSPGVRGRHKQGRKWELTSQGEAPRSPPKTHHPIDTPKTQGPPSFSFRKRNAMSVPTTGLPQEDAASVAVGTKCFPLHSGAKRQLFRNCRLSGTLQLKLADRVTRSTSKVLHLRKSTVRIKFRNILQERQGRPALTGKKQKRPGSLLLRSFRQQRMGARRTPRHRGYPELVGKRIRHLYEEKDKSEAWYRGVVLRVYKPHKDPLKTVYEVKYDSEPEWEYYLEILQDYKKGWLEVDE